MSWCLPPSPWKRMTPAVVATPSGSVSEQLSCVPSDIGIVSCCGVAAFAVAVNASAHTATPRALRSTGARVASLPMDPRPIGVFDSGVGGLTVLHECLVPMPNEDFLYVGDSAQGRFPYGTRDAETIRRFSGEIATHLQSCGVKLMVVACNSATA